MIKKIIINFFFSFIYYYKHTSITLAWFVLQVIQGDLPLDGSGYTPLHWACYNGKKICHKGRHYSWAKEYYYLLTFDIIEAQLKSAYIYLWQLVYN